MTDDQILNQYWARSESAISETHKKYGPYCYSIAYHILFDHQDSEECVSDTYLRAWNSIPPRRPNHFGAYLGKITRNLSINRLQKETAKKSGGGQAEIALDELMGAIPDCQDAVTEKVVFIDVLNRFLDGLNPETRKIFMMRYWLFASVKEIAQRLGISESKVKQVLMRTREKLRIALQKEDIVL